jgi:hypothetical protein
MKKQLIKYINLPFCLIISAALFSSAGVRAQGNLIIMPRRVVFQGQKRTQELNVANTGTDTATYVLSVIHYRMLENGGFELITQPDSGQKFADANIRFFPRTVVLAPNETQVVKVQLTNTGQLTPGEYRSHLYFRAVPAEKRLDEKGLAAKKGSISIKLNAVFGIAIPIIIQNGVSTTEASFSDVTVKTEGDSRAVLNFFIHRKGNMSVYGDIKVFYVSPKNATTLVGIINGLAVYTPNARRSVQLKLEPNEHINYHTGKLHIVYQAPSEARPEKFAETDLQLN